MFKDDVCEMLSISSRPQCAKKQTSFQTAKSDTGLILPETTMAEIKGSTVSDLFAGIGTIEDSSPPSVNEAFLTEIHRTYIK